MSSFKKDMSILIVEDDEGLNTLIKTKLEREGFSCTSIFSGNDLLSHGFSGVPLLIIDYQLPDIPAAEVIRSLQEKGVEISFIVMTGHGDVKTAVEMMKLGARDYLVKDPGFLELLPAVVKGVIKNIEKERKLEAAENALILSEERYKVLADNIADVIFTTTNDLRINYISPSISRLLGYAPEEMQGFALDDWLTNESSEIASTVFSEAFFDSVNNNRDTNVVLEFEMKKKDASYVWTEVKISYLKDPQGNVLGLLGVARDITERKEHEKKINDSISRMNKALEGSIQAMGKTTEIRDPYTAGHQRRVSNLAYQISRELGFDDEQCQVIRLAAEIHDIGKIYVPAEILAKPGKISKVEFDMIKNHSRVGYDILKTIEFPWPIAEIVLQHHERIDGSGYPEGLKGNSILLEARIICVADVVEAMASHRPYRPSLGLNRAIDEIKMNRNVKYDGNVVDACIRVLMRKDFEF